MCFARAAAGVLALKTHRALGKQRPSPPSGADTRPHSPTPAPSHCHYPDSAGGAHPHRCWTRGRAPFPFPRRARACAHGPRGVRRIAGRRFASSAPKSLQLLLVGVHLRRLFPTHHTLVLGPDAIAVRRSHLSAIEPTSTPYSTYVPSPQCHERRRERTVAPRHSLQELTQTRPLSLLPSNDLQGPGRVEPELR